MKSSTAVKPGIYPLLRRHERLSVWEKARGMWKDRMPDPIKDLAAMRREWERDEIVSD